MKYNIADKRFKNDTDKKQDIESDTIRKYRTTGVHKTEPEHPGNFDYIWWLI
jgi:hypothetical protein